MINICKDCKHYICTNRCIHHYNAKTVVEPLLGNNITIYRYSARDHRNAGKFKAAWFNLCGKEAYWFEEKEVPEKV